MSGDKTSSSMTPTEFLTTHAENMQPDLPVEDLPFYKWLVSCNHPPGKLVPALQLYYSGHELKGCFSTEEIASYRHILQHFWWRKLNVEERR